MLLNLLAFSQSNIIKRAADDGIYEAIQSTLATQYPNKPDLVKCMVGDLKGKNVASKIPAADVSNSDKIKKRIEPCKIDLLPLLHKSTNI